MLLTGLKKIFWLLSGCLALVGCEVVELDADSRPIIPMSEEEAAAIRNMQPKDIAEKLWANVLQDAKANVVTLDELGDKAQDGKSYFVQIQGTIARIDEQSGSVNLVVKTQNPEIPIQIGTIVRGNAIRDASSLFGFDQFKNQIQFARLSKELSRKAIASVDKPEQSAVGKPVEILAALTWKNERAVDAVPLEINISE